MLNVEVLSIGPGLPCACSECVI